MSGTRKYLPLHHHNGTPKRRMKETLFTRHRNTVEPMMLADNRKATLQAIHTQSTRLSNIRKIIKCYMSFHTQLTTQKKNLTRKEHATLAQLISGYCKLLGSYKSRIKKDASLNVCADSDYTPHDVKHLFACPAHPTTLDSIGEFSYLEAGNLD